MAIAFIGTGEIKMEVNPDEWCQATGCHKLDGKPQVCANKGCVRKICSECSPTNRYCHTCKDWCEEYKCGVCGAGVLPEGHIMSRGLDYFKGDAVKVCKTCQDMPLEEFRTKLQAIRAKAVPVYCCECDNPVLGEAKFKCPMEKGERQEKCTAVWCHECGPKRKTEYEICSECFERWQDWGETEEEKDDDWAIAPCIDCGNLFVQAGEDGAQCTICFQPLCLECGGPNEVCKADHHLSPFVQADQEEVKRLATTLCCDCSKALKPDPISGKFVHPCGFSGCKAARCDKCAHACTSKYEMCNDCYQAWDNDEDEAYYLAPCIECGEQTTEHTDDTFCQVCEQPLCKKCNNEDQTCLKCRERSF